MAAAGRRCTEAAQSYMKAAAIPGNEDLLNTAKNRLNDAVSNLTAAESSATAADYEAVTEGYEALFTATGNTSYQRPLHNSKKRGLPSKYRNHAPKMLKFPQT